MYKTALICSSFAWILLLVSAVAGSSGSGVGATWLGPKEHDFGIISQGKPVVHRFVFQNTGIAPLTIDNVRTPCGCTAAAWPEAPVAPGDTASIVLEYNAAQSGNFYKVVKVFFHGVRGGDRLVVRGTVQ